MVSSSWNGEGLDGWEDELERPDGHPFLALVLGGVAILIAGVTILSFLTVDISQHVLVALGIAALGGVAVFGVAWFVTLRHASTGWMIGAGATFLGLALLCVASAVGAANIAVRMDVAALREIRIGPDGQPTLPRGARRGPIVQLGLTYYREMVEEKNKREALLVAELGLDRLTNANALVRAPQLLRDCERFYRAKPTLDTSDKRFVAIAAKFRSSLGVAIHDVSLRDEAMKAFDKGFGDSAVELKEMSELQHQQLDAAVPLCTLLARKNWVDRGKMFEFSSQGDLNTFDAKVGPWNDLVRRQQDLVARSQARINALPDGARPPRAPRF